MKTISTAIATGTKVKQENLFGVVGLYRNGLIEVSYKINETSQITQRYTTRQINSLIKSNKITIIE